MNLYQMIYTFKDMLSYEELNYDVYIYKSTETDYFITLFFLLTIMMKSDLFVSYPYLY